MHLYIIRHAEAFPVGEQGITADFDRCLTPKGQKQAARLGKLLRTMGVALDVVFTSPLVRARQTAEGLTAVLKPRPKIRVAPELQPGISIAAVANLARTPNVPNVAVVGHEPDLGNLLGCLTTGIREARVEFSKGSIACVELLGEAQANQLRWLLHQSAIKALVD